MKALYNATLLLVLILKWNAFALLIAHIPVGRSSGVSQKLSTGVEHGLVWPVLFLATATLIPKNTKISLT